MNHHATPTHPTRLLRGARLVTPPGVVAGVSVRVVDGRIAQLHNDASANAPRADETLDLDGLTLYPGFIDVHIHGAIGVDTTEANADDLRRLSRFLAMQGTTAWLPTLVPAPDGHYQRAAEAVAALMSKAHDAEGGDSAATNGARALGLHYEGPFVNEAQCGALRTAYFRRYDSPADVDALAVVQHPDAKHLITVAPEIAGGVALVGELTGRGFVISLGHTRATLDVLDAACVAGARHMTHFFNAMSPLHHRQPGPIGWGLLRDDVTCDVIADGVHCDPLMLRLALRCKTAERLMLISDAVAPTGLGDGAYQLWNETITVKDGRTGNARGQIAGSVITMLDAVRTMLALNVTPPDVARMAALNPARLLGLADDYGSIETGKRADLVALDDDGNVRLTLVGGRVAFIADGVAVASSDRSK